MTKLIRVELAKLRTVRLSYGLLGLGAGLTMLFAILEASLAGGKGSYDPAALSTPSGFESVMNGGVWVLILATVFGVTVSSGEFRHLSATLTYLATPARNRVLAAKTVAAFVAGAAFGLAGFVIGCGTALGFAAAKGTGVPLSAGTLAGHGAGYLIAAGLLAALGAVVGSLVRAQLAAVIGVFVWTMIIESLVGGLLTGIRPYLPYTTATTLTGTSLGGGAFGPAREVASGAPLPFAAAAALLASLTIVLAMIAARTTVRRDIT